MIDDNGCKEISPIKPNGTNNSLIINLTPPPNYQQKIFTLCDLRNTSFVMTRGGIDSGILYRAGITKTEHLLQPRLVYFYRFTAARKQPTRNREGTNT